VGWLPKGVSGASAREAAAARNVDVTPVSRYAIRRGVQALALALAPLVRSRTRR